MASFSLHSDSTTSHNTTTTTTTTEYVDDFCQFPSCLPVLSTTNPSEEDSVPSHQNTPLSVCESFTKDAETTEVTLDTVLARDIYSNLRAAEMKNRPSTNFLETVQKEIDADMRASVVERLVQLVDDFQLTSETLYLAVNYLDRYLSSNSVRYSKLQLLGIACVLIASKHDEGEWHINIDDLCNLYSKEEVLQMEAEVLHYLTFELTVPTIKCFLRGFVHVAQGPPKLRFLADYIAELSLFECRMLCYSPSMIAASSIFVARFILKSMVHPWSAALRNYAQYRAGELYECVKDLHKLFCYSNLTKFTAIRKKYMQPDYMFVANICSLPWIPSKFFQDTSN